MVVEPFKFKGKMSAAPQVEITADHHLEGGKCTYARHHQFLINNSSDNIVCQSSYGEFNGAFHLLVGCVVAMLFKCKGKMSALKIRCRSPAGGGEMHPWWTPTIPYE